MSSPPVLLVAAIFAVSCGFSKPSHPEIAVRVGFVGLDQRSQSPVVVLEELEGSRLLPIWIGFAEAQSIEAERRGVQSLRPNTHDLTKRLLDRLHANVERMVVTEISGGVYYALLVVRTNEGLVKVDARPSDAIAIALRYQAPLFVRELLFQDGDAPPTPEGEGREI